jgi:hypothetical protein
MILLPLKSIRADACYGAWAFLGTNLGLLIVSAIHFKVNKLVAHIYPMGRQSCTPNLNVFSLAGIFTGQGFPLRNDVANACIVSLSHLRSCISVLFALPNPLCAATLSLPLPSCFLPLSPSVCLPLGAYLCLMACSYCQNRRASLAICAAEELCDRSLARGQHIRDH